MTIPTSRDGADPSPSSAAFLRGLILDRLAQMGWSASAAAETGLSTTVMLNDLMVGASVDMTQVFDAEGSSAQSDAVMSVLAFSLTTEHPIDIPQGTVVRTGDPEVSISQHRTLDLVGCLAEVRAAGPAEDITERVIAALAATVEQFRLLSAVPS